MISDRAMSLSGEADRERSKSTKEKSFDSAKKAESIERPKVEATTLFSSFDDRSNSQMRAINIVGSSLPDYINVKRRFIIFFVNSNFFFA